MLSVSDLFYMKDDENYLRNILSKGPVLDLLARISNLRKSGVFKFPTEKFTE